MTDTPNSSDPGGLSSHPRAEVQQAANRLDAVLETLPWLSPESMAKLTNTILLTNTRPALKLIKLTELATKVDLALRPHYSCGRGCSHCCSMITLIYRYEAVRLAEVTGREMIELPFRPHDQVLLAGMLVNGKQCAFVVDGCCSVYEHRPMICRLHHSFNKDPRDCEVSCDPTLKRPIVQFNPDYVEVPYHNVVRFNYPREPWGAITEFFPV